jgi:hypothetical protein
MTTTTKSLEFMITSKMKLERVHGPLGEIIELEESITLEPGQYILEFNIEKGLAKFHRKEGAEPHA